MEIKAGEIFRDTAKSLKGVYESPENDSVAMLLIEGVLGISRRNILLDESMEIDASMQHKLREAVEKCLAHIPVQHVLGAGAFYGRDFRVGRDVLIPRPETEELVYLVLSTYKGRSLKAVDIGTGSGCIGITLALEHSAAEIMALDVSEAALEVAKDNADRLGAKLQFVQLDVLAEPLPTSELDAVVSNPPYIPVKEKKSMEQRVTVYEPEMALFVPDEDPLLFYRRIGELALLHLREGGGLFVEIHESYGMEVVALYREQGYKMVECLPDMQGKPRMVRAFRP
ncbi:peptide chain release factor N(5)-glutamine methyltransferase [Roseivirga sp. BDSF3-8]|uniref:peptide chain release factor N(5)-glutamine methyltransferase n=1 Tax=Roseivirga sp. BDSF3-8 TaxID=3241598 RepID=UPI003531B6C9